MKLADLEGIWDYIAKDSPSAARAVMIFITDADTATRGRSRLRGISPARWALQPNASRMAPRPERGNSRRNVRVGNPLSGQPETTSVILSPEGPQGVRPPRGREGRERPPIANHHPAAVGAEAQEDHWICPAH